MTTPRTASELITEEVAAWPGVEAGLGRRSEFAFSRSASTITPFFPAGPFAARRIETEADIQDVIELLRLNYDRMVGRFGPPAEAA